MSPLPQALKRPVLLVSSRGHHWCEERGSSTLFLMDFVIPSSPNLQYFLFFLEGDRRGLMEQTTCSRERKSHRHLMVCDTAPSSVRNDVILRSAQPSFLSIGFWLSWSQSRKIVITFLLLSQRKLDLFPQTTAQPFLPPSLRFSKILL